ncbi:MAG: alpha/beta fold hydrolase [Pseudomonadota bacterium]
MEGFGPQDWLRHWQEGQQAFWTASLTAGVENAQAFAEPDWQAFDDAMAHILAAATPQDHRAEWEAARDAGVRYRDLIQAAFARVGDAFAIQCRAIHGAGGAAMDWRLLRDRWFDLAEEEFIRVLRTPDFLDVQRDALRTGATLWHRLPSDARQLAQKQRRLGATAHQTLTAIGAEMVPIAQTPKDLVWEEGRTTLWRYRPFTKPTLGPVLIYHGLIGRQTLTDLRPERSLVRNLLAAGVDVLVLDWGNAGPEDAQLGLGHFIAEKTPVAIEKACEVTGSDAVVLLGICQGGTLAACHAALPDHRLKGLITAVAPFDFHADAYDSDPAHGLLHVWLRSLAPSDVDALIGMDGNLSGELTGAVFNQLNPVRTLAKYAIEMLELGSNPVEMTTFLAMENWLADRPDMPGALARTWLVDFYQRNDLIRGQLKVAGTPVDLSQIDVPVLNIFATGDHIVPPPCSRALATVLEGETYSELSVQTGHVGTFVSGKSQSRLGPSIVGWLNRHVE